MASDQVHSQGERGARYILGGMGRGEWLHIAIDIRAKRALEDLADRYGISQRNVLERLLAQADQTLQEDGEAAPAGHDFLRTECLPIDSEAMAS